MGWGLNQQLLNFKRKASCPLIHSPQLPCSLFKTAAVLTLNHVYPSIPVQQFHRKACIHDRIKIGLLHCYVCRCSWWTNHAHTKDPKQRRTAHLEKFKVWSCHTAFERTLAPSKIPHLVQARNTCFPSLWQHSSAIPVFFSLHISTIALPSFFKRQTWKPLVDVFLVTLLQLSGTRCQPTWELLPPSKVSKLSWKHISSAKLSDWSVHASCYLFHIHLCVCVNTGVCVSGWVGRCRVSVSGGFSWIWYSSKHSGES